VHAPANFGKAFGIGVALNAGFVVLEVVYGVLGHSIALLADAGHNLSDVLSLSVAWFATVLAKRHPTTRFTYGFGGSSVLAALFNAVFLLVVIGGLSWEAIGRLFHPEPVAGKTVTIVAAIGIAINGICAWLFASGRKGDLNIRARSCIWQPTRWSQSAWSSPAW
jgi:cobalt-zinc-cadmium efflux system protein